MVNDRIREIWLSDGLLLHANRLTLSEFIFCNILQENGPQRMRVIVDKMDSNEQEGNRIARSLMRKYYIQRDTHDFSVKSDKGPKNVFYYSLRQFQI